jgi:hypothetical protein
MILRLADLEMFPRIGGLGKAMRCRVVFAAG